ncbi:MAG: hypothetical protein IIB39_10980 [Candidatus Marinimicrobia bacterium]|nr:hypothetical protein [Candidatus Neomarinimicrobiota bacterium]
MNSLKYFVDGSKLVLELEAKPKGKVSVRQVSDLVVHHIDEKGNILKAEITGLWRLPKMEENVTIAEWDGKRGKKKK